MSDNSVGGVLVDSPTTATIQYNDTSGNTGYDLKAASGTLTGVGNITSDPKFTDAAAGDYTLTGFSACIDGGNPLKGYNDVDGSTNDIGAFGGPYGDWTP